MIKSFSSRLEVVTVALGHYKVDLPQVDRSRFLFYVKHRLRELIAGALFVEGSEHNLAPEDLEVWGEPVGVFDVQPQALLLVVEASDYPERHAIVERAAEQLANRLKNGLNTSGRVAVWVKVGSLDGWFEA